MTAKGPWASSVLQDLEVEGKLRRAKASELGQLTDAEVQLFRGPGHTNIRDDGHLFRTARGKRARFVVTQDEWILGKADQLLSAFGVETIRPEEAVRRMQGDEGDRG